MANSFAAVVAAVAPVDTVVAATVVPVAVLNRSTAPAPVTVDRPEYSSTCMPIAAVPVGVAVTAGRLPPPLTIGAVHTLNSVESEALTWATRV
jgi:hypothetical protein